MNHYYVSGRTVPIPISEEEGTLIELEKVSGIDNIIFLSEGWENSFRHGSNFSGQMKFLSTDVSYEKALKIVSVIKHDPKIHFVDIETSLIY